MGSLLHALKPASLRSRKDSSTSQEATPTTSQSPDDFGFPRTMTLEPETTAAPDGSPTTPSPRRLFHSRSIDTLPTVSRTHTNRPRSHLLLREDPRGRQPSLSSLEAARSPTLRPPPRRDSYQLPPSLSPKEMLPTPAPVTSLWRSFSFLPFLSRDAVPHNIPDERPLTPESPPPPAPQKGDIVCLSYDTLDDTAMRRLQAKSDHRPVIGSYAIYI